MRSHEFIVEYRRDITSQKYGQKMLVRFRNGWDRRLADLEASDEETLDRIYDYIEQGDPTKNKKYVPWLAREYAKGNFRSVEDILSTLYPYLELHARRSRSPNFPENLRDITKLTAQEFYYGMEEYGVPQEEQVDRGEYKVIIDNSEVRVIQPIDKTAACYYGQGTRWCTAATQSHNFFDSYNKRGPLYIMIPKDSNYNGEKYQIHFASSQWMNQNDDPVDLQDLMDRFPSLKDTFFNEHKDELKKLIQFMSYDELYDLTDRAIGYGIAEVENFVTDQLQKAVQEYQKNYAEGDAEVVRDIIEAETSVYYRELKRLREFVKVALTDENLQKYKTEDIKEFVSKYAMQPMGSNINWFIKSALNPIVPNDDYTFIRLYREFASTIAELPRKFKYYHGRWVITD